ncbi:MAG: hypothetical protein L6E13_04980 [Firmicutes bacterium]|nr:hypothetical protein [Bacillota bacterium]
MVLVRELILLLAAAVSTWPLALALGLRGSPGAVLSGLLFVPPFQAGYALAALVGKRAPAPVLGLLGLAGWLGSFWPVLSRGTLLALRAGLPDISRLMLPMAAAPVVLALLAGAALPRGRGLRGAAAALFLWSVPFTGVRWALAELMPAAAAPVLQVMGGVGAVYLTLRVLAALAWPLSVDQPFQRG